MGIRLACSTIGFRDQLHASARTREIKLRGYLEMPRLGGPGGKPAQACMGIRLDRSLASCVVLIFRVVRE